MIECHAAKEKSAGWSTATLNVAPAVIGKRSHTTKASALGHASPAGGQKFSADTIGTLGGYTAKPKNVGSSAARSLFDRAVMVNESPVNSSAYTALAESGSR